MVKMTTYDNIHTYHIAMFGLPGPLLNLMSHIMMPIGTKERIECRKQVLQNVGPPGTKVWSLFDELIRMMDSDSNRLLSWMHSMLRGVHPVL